MADANVGKTETSAAALAVVSQEVQSYLIQKSILMPTVKNYSNLAVKGANSIKVPRGGSFTVQSKSENTSAVLQDTNLFAVDTISLDKHQYVQFLVEDIADVQTTVAYAQDSLMRASASMALAVDTAIITALKAASASAPDHKINYIDTSTNVIAKGDILAARKLLIDQYIDPRECFMMVGSSKEAQLLGLADFVQAERYGSNSPIMNGEFGMIYGMKVLVHTGLSAGEMLLWHPSAVGYAFQLQPRVQTQPDLKELGIRYSIDQLWGVATLDSGKRQVLTENT
jgi:N4-gp56 family major capsid protein